MSASRFERRLLGLPHSVSLHMGLLFFCMFGVSEVPAQVSMISDGLPPFLRSMEKHEVMVQVQLQEGAETPRLAPEGLRVRFQITAGGMKVKEYEARSDGEGRAFFPGIPSNSEVQQRIAYRLFIDYQGVRYPFSLRGIPRTVDREAFYTELDPAVRLPENRVTVTLQLPVNATPSLEGLSLSHRLIELHPDEDALVFIHDLSVRNEGDRPVNLAQLPRGGLPIPAPAGAKEPRVREEEKGRFEVRGSDLYFTGVIAARGEQRVRLSYTVPYRSARFEFSLRAPIPSSLNIVVAPRFKKRQHQRAFPLRLGSYDGATVDARETGPGMLFDVLRRETPLAAGEALRFSVQGLPQIGRMRRFLTYGGLILIFIALLVIAVRSKGTAGLSRAHLEGERDRLLHTLERLERAYSRERIGARRYEREREAITARLVTLYRSLEEMSGSAQG